MTEGFFDECAQPQPTATGTLKWIDFPNKLQQFRPRDSVRTSLGVHVFERKCELQFERRLGDDTASVLGGRRKNSMKSNLMLASRRNQPGQATKSTDGLEENHALPAFSLSSQGECNTTILGRAKLVFGERRAGHIAAQLDSSLLVVGGDSHRGVHTEPTKLDARRGRFVDLGGCQHRRLSLSAHRPPVQRRDLRIIPVLTQEAPFLEKSLHS